MTTASNIVAYSSKWTSHVLFAWYFASSPAQVLNAATVVAKHTSSLCNTCRHASSKTNNPIAKRHFVQSAKDVAYNTANLVRAIKVREPCQEIGQFKWCKRDDWL